MWHLTLPSNLSLRTSHPPSTHTHSCGKPSQTMRFIFSAGLLLLGLAASATAAASAGGLEVRGVM